VLFCDVVTSDVVPREQDVAGLSRKRNYILDKYPASTLNMLTR